MAGHGRQGDAVRQGQPLRPHQRRIRALFPLRFEKLAYARYESRKDPRSRSMLMSMPWAPARRLRHVRQLPQEELHRCRDWRRWNHFLVPNALLSGPVSRAAPGHGATTIGQDVLLACGKAIAQNLRRARHVPGARRVPGPCGGKEERAIYRFESARV